MIPQVDMSSYDQQGCLHDMFTKQAQKTPTKLAVVSPDGSQITFQELDRVTNLLANHLRTLGVCKNKVVGILMERSVEYTISYIAILKAGGAYLPIEMSYPSSLVMSVLKDAQTALVCTKRAYMSRLKDSVATVNVEQDLLTSLDRKKDQYSFIDVETIGLDNIAYTVYSSGTTGKPKGIQCTHRGAVFSYTWRHLAFPYKEDDREACNIFFVWEMLRPLLQGVTMYVIPDTVIYDPTKLLNFLQENLITRMLFTPSLLQTILDTQQHSTVAESFKSMRQIWLCGEVVTTTLRRRTASLLPWVKILNLYSISECHDISCSDLSTGQGLEGRTYCPVGKLFPMVRALILDGNLNEKSPGDAGEIYIGGPTLAIGYLNREDLNRERFINAPAKLAKYDGERLYKTGDWGYLLSDGSLEVIGRCDSMVKIRGYTVERKAVENALLNLTEVSMTCVLAVGAEGSNKMLVAYVVPTNRTFTNLNYLRVKLKEQLPFYMIPSQFVFLEKIPILDTTGKTNTKELPEIPAFSEDDIVLDKNLFEDENAHSIARIWCNILKLSTVDENDNFFDVGGHSLLAAIVIGKINDEFGTSWTTFDLYANTTIKALAHKMNTGENSSVQKINLVQELKKYTVQQISNISLRTFWKSVNLSNIRFQRGNVLVTGAVGFLGSFVTQNFIKNTQVFVYCMVRSTVKETAEQRLLASLNSLGMSSDLLDSKLVVIPGDISLNKFGLDETEYEALCYDIDLVVHCAAYVNLVLPCSALWQTNVIGTKNVVSFCMEGKLKPLHHISTNDVFPVDKQNYAEEANMLFHVDKLDYGYAETKWLAEQIVMSASKAGLPTIISRCGNIGGCRNSGTWNTNDMNLLILQAVIMTKSAPDISWKIEFTPVDFVSEVIVKLSQNLIKEYGKIYHLINPNTMASRDLWKLLQSHGYDIKVVPYNEWVQIITKASTSTNSHQLISLMHLLQSRLKNCDYLVNSCTFSQNNTREFLALHALVYPQINVTTMDRILQDLQTNNYIPKSKTTYLTSEVTQSRLKGKIALVTGASSGIGYGIVMALSRAGVRTVGVARSLDRLIELQKKLQDEDVQTFLPMQVDITSSKEVLNCVKQIEASLGPVDILVNNAGLMEYCKMANANLDWWLEMVRVNCIGFLHTLAAVLPHMKERQSGHIINITSDAGRKPFANLAVYSGTKFFQEAVSEAMRQEIAPCGIKVSCIQPGDVQTGLHEKSKDRKTKEENSYQIEYLRVEDVTNTVLFVLNQPDNCAVNSVLVEPKLGPI